MGAIVGLDVVGSFVGSAVGSGVEVGSAVGPGVEVGSAVGSGVEVGSTVGSGVAVGSAVGSRVVSPMVGSSVGLAEGLEVIWVLRLCLSGLLILIVPIIPERNSVGLDAAKGSRGDRCFVFLDVSTNPNLRLPSAEVTRHVQTRTKRLKEAWPCLFYSVWKLYPASGLLVGWQLCSRVNALLVPSVLLASKVECIQNKKMSSLKEKTRRK